MRAWTTMLGGLGLWAVHFFGLYLIASIAEGAPARLLALALTAILLIADVFLLRRAVLSLRAATDQGERWAVGLGLLSAALALLAIAWQGLPAIMV